MNTRRSFFKRLAAGAAALLGLGSAKVPLVPFNLRCCGGACNCHTTGEPGAPCLICMARMRIRDAPGPLQGKVSDMITIDEVRGKPVKFISLDEVRARHRFKILRVWVTREELEKRYPR